MCSSLKALGVSMRRLGPFQCFGACGPARARQPPSFYLPMLAVGGPPQVFGEFQDAPGPRRACGLPRGPGAEAHPRLHQPDLHRHRHGAATAGIWLRQKLPAIRSRFWPLRRNSACTLLTFGGQPVLRASTRPPPASFLPLDNPPSQPPLTGHPNRYSRRCPSAGRLAMDEPNLQTVPKPQDYKVLLSQGSGGAAATDTASLASGPASAHATRTANLRAAFVAPPGHVLLSGGRRGGEGGVHCTDSGEEDSTDRWGESLLTAWAACRGWHAASQLVDTGRRTSRLASSIWLSACCNTVSLTARLTCSNPPTLSRSRLPPDRVPPHGSLQRRRGAGAGLCRRRRRPLPPAGGTVAGGCGGGGGQVLRLCACEGEGRGLSLV